MELICRNYIEKYFLKENESENVIQPPFMTAFFLSKSFSLFVIGPNGAFKTVRCVGMEHFLKI